MSTTTSSEIQRKITIEDAVLLMRHHIAEAYRTRLKGEVMIRIRFNCGGIVSVKDGVDRDNPLDTIGLSE